MKLFRFLLLMTLVCGFAGSAKAYRVSILDPLSRYAISQVPFDVTFAQCQLGDLPGGAAPTADQFCFTGINLTGSTITNLEIVIPDKGSLVGQTPDSPDCGSTSSTPGSLTFASSTCVVQNGFQVIYFTGLDIPTNTFDNSDQFLILISGLPADTTFPTNTDGSTPPAIVIPNAVPEPSSVVLLSTGLLLGGVFLIKRRNLVTVSAPSNFTIR